VALQAARWKEILTGEKSEPVEIKTKKSGGHGDGGVE
jgi:argininosuccinate lyase